jgi:hypothetical protein
MPVARRNVAWLNRLLASVLERLRSQEAAATPERHATVAHVERALAELSEPSPDETLIKAAVLVALADLEHMPSAKDLCASLRTAAAHVFGATLP